MLIELDYETVSALEAALIVADIADSRYAINFERMAARETDAEARQEALELAAFNRRRAERFRKAQAALERAKEEGPHA